MLGGEWVTESGCVGVVERHVGSWMEGFGLRFEVGEMETRFSNLLAHGYEMLLL